MVYTDNKQKEALSPVPARNLLQELDQIKSDIKNKIEKIEEVDDILSELGDQLDDLNLQEAKLIIEIKKQIGS